jgi:hypothetical protein
VRSVQSVHRPKGLDVGQGVTFGMLWNALVALPTYYLPCSGITVAQECDILIVGAGIAA